MKKYIDGDLRDPQNLFRDCKKTSMNIKDPRHITREELQCEIMVTSRNIEALRKKAPKLRRQHFKVLHCKAVEKGDEERAATILRILHREACRKSW